MTAVITATAIKIEASNHSEMQSVSQLLANGTDEINSIS